MKKAAQSGEIAVAYDAAAALWDFEAVAGLNLQVIAAGRNHVVALRRDGTVAAAGTMTRASAMSRAGPILWKYAQGIPLLIQ